MKKYIGLAFIVFVLSACQLLYIPPSPLKAPIEQGKVALFIDVNNSPIHTHVGLTVFNNFSKRYSYNWGLEEEIFSLLKEDIETNTKLDVVNLKDMGLSLANIHKWDFVRVDQKQWAASKKFNNIREALIRQGVVAVVRIIEKPTEVSLECSNYGCISRFANGYGLFSRGIFGLKHYQVAPSFEITAENFSPNVDMTRLVSFSRLTSTTGIPIAKQNKPKNLYKVTEKEFEFVKAVILDRIKMFSGHLVNFFNAKVEG